MANPRSPLILNAPTNTSVAAPTLDAAQARVVSMSPGHGPILVLGGPGSGRTTVAVEYLVQRVADGLDPERMLLLTGTRQGSARLRDQLTARLNHEGLMTRGGSPVRSFASYAFDVIRRMRAEGLLPHLQRPPRLLAGAEQDRVIAELLEGYELIPDFGPSWPESLAEAIGLRGFRKEIRELIDRTSEYGIEPGDLETLGVTHHRMEWVAAARLLQDYRDTLDLGRGEAFDPAGLITTACHHWERLPEFAQQERERLPVIVVDDFQDATPAVHRLVTMLATDQDSVITASPETTVQGFRGARPDFLREYPQRLISSELSNENRAQRIVVLEKGHRMTPSTQQAWQRIASRVPAVPGLPQAQTQLSSVVPEHSTAQQVAVHWVGSSIQQQLLILQQVLHLHHRHEIPLAEIAVIARTGSAVTHIGQQLENEGVAVKRRMSDTVLNAEPAVAPLLAMIDAGVAPADADHAETQHADTEEDAPASVALSDNQISWLLRGRYGTMSSLQVRRLRQKLLAVERKSGGQRHSAELLNTLLADPESFYSLLDLEPEWRLPEYAQGAYRIAIMLAAGTANASQPGSNAESVLWAVWAAVEKDVARLWEAEALGEDPVAARRANRDLDAVVALFDAAERYVDQFPGQSAAGFTEYLEEQELPMDTLAAGTVTDDAVSVLTPSSAAGQEWEAVIIAEVQEGVWPNTRLRGQLLHTQQLVDIVTGRGAATPYVDQLAQVRHDELRTFSAAASRARQWLIGIAVSDDDTQPSPFLDYIQPWRELDHGRPLTRMSPPLTEPALVSGLRQELESIARGDSPANPQPVAAALTVLAQAGISSADPKNWWGLLSQSTTSPIQGPGAPIPENMDVSPVYLSPSKVETALASPLNWFISQAGGQPGSSLAMNLGNLIHSLAEDHPDGDLAALTAQFHDRFDELGMDEGWEADVQRARALIMLEYFIDYLHQMRQDGRTLAKTEHFVQQMMELGELNIIINGVIDRLEVTADGHPYVVDLKTGKEAPSEKAMLQQPQLGVYQAIIKAGVLNELAHDIPRNDSPAGALLVQLGTRNKSVKLQHQAPLPAGHSWAESLIEQAAHAILGPHFLAVHDTRTATRCALPMLCPICPEGKQVTEWTR